MKLHAGHIEVAVAKLLNWRIHVIVPNVSWGLGLRHECDMLMLDDKGRFTEIEIKVTASDLKRDFKKMHGHSSRYISRLVYAMPLALVEKHADIIPKQFGIIAVDVVNDYRSSRGMIMARWWRHARHHDTEKPAAAVVSKFMKLGCMRIWSLKEANHRLSEKINPRQ